MQSRALEILVGFFVCLGVAAVFVLTFRAASIDNVGKGPVYRVVATFEIGRVREIRINQESFQADVSIDLSQQFNKIPEDSNVKILTAGLLGEQYIGVEPGGSDDVLKDGSKIMLTQSALVLENLIGQFLASQAGPKDDKLADAIGKLADSIKPAEPAAPGVK